MSTILIIPGLNGSGEEHWQSHWERRLANTVRVQQDDWSTPDLDRWAARIIETASQYDSVWLIAHSITGTRCDRRQPQRSLVVMAQGTAVGG